MANGGHSCCFTRDYVGEMTNENTLFPHLDRDVHYHQDALRLAYTQNETASTMNFGLPLCV